MPFQVEIRKRLSIVRGTHQLIITNLMDFRIHQVYQCAMIIVDFLAKEILE